MILYLRIGVIFWTIAESSSLRFNQYISKCRDLGTWWRLHLLKLPRWGRVQCRDSCSNNAAGRTDTDVSVHGCCCFKQNSCQPHAEREKKQKKQPKCTWRVYCRIKGTSSSAFPISEGSNVNPLSLFLSFHLHPTLNSLRCDFLLALIFYAFLFWFSTFSWVPLLLRLCFPYRLCCMCDTRFLLTRCCSVWRQKWTNKDAGGLSCLV